ncbi:hypothetical protein SCLCIDRAFT_87096, partial [Scleroderma citrinum Foug A]
KKGNTKDLLTVFFNCVKVKFLMADGKVEALTGQWCKICKEDEVFVWKFGKRKTFHFGSNSLCCQHIHVHYEKYQQHCAADNIKV